MCFRVEIRFRAPLELVHTDLAGPLTWRQRKDLDYTIAFTWCTDMDSEPVNKRSQQNSIFTSFKKIY